MNIRRTLRMSEEEFTNQLNNNDFLDKYDGFILDIINTTTIRDSNIYYKLRETFHEFLVSKSTFYRYIKKLRKDNGYDRFKRKGTSIREEPLPGEEAQIDFGQYKMKDMYGITRRVYFFVMEMRYSQFKFHINLLCISIVKGDMYQI